MCCTRLRHIYLARRFWHRTEHIPSFEFISVSESFRKICKYKILDFLSEGSWSHQSDCSSRVAKSLLCLSDQSCLIAGASQQKCHKNTKNINYFCSELVYKGRVVCVILFSSMMPSALLHICKLLVKRERTAGREQIATAGWSVIICEGNNV